MQTFGPILIYFVFLFVVGFSLRKVSSKGSKEFFLGGRDMPWWLAGTSIVATTFAADTPLVITGLMATKGFSGNWFWLSALFAHAAVVVIFAKCWSRAGTVTDTELLSIRYSGKSAHYLRYFKAFIGGVIVNCIIMGWVIRAMVKVCSQFLNWQEMTPRLYSFVDSFWPNVGVLGNASDAITIVLLILIVMIYSSMGGLKAVMYTDLIQFGVAVFATSYLAYEIWAEVGGRQGIVSGLINQYGENHQFTNLFPTEETGWLKKLNVGFGLFMIYLFAQSSSRLDVDGSGYLMQRLNSCKSDKDATKASMLFVTLHYLVRAWPWMIVGMGALILIPLGQEETVFNGAAAAIGSDRELAFPFLMKQYLSPFMQGLLLTSFLAAFMSTIDTHLNWGSSYVVNDWLPLIKNDADQKTKTLISRLSIWSFGTIAILVSFQIGSIEKAWQWMAALSASVGIPNILRWLWWRVTAFGEICAMVTGITVALLLQFSDVPYEFRLILVSGSGILGLILGITFGPKTDQKVLESFQEKVRPVGIWPGHAVFPIKEIFQVFGLILTGVFLFWLGKGLLFGF
ncbi:MAG: sodium:solute symporter family protein [Bacteriovoracaceae bacterium]